ncbi:MAG: 4-hydroxy-tetrahydrodipicolinate synthase [Candidatus Aureabacteria bacterium]|nr:4-hydroxy-tetrahydrodipicolinate synthase [Candidatus Auribacterota bacterium]
MLQGSMVAIVTPFKDGKVDEETLKNLIDRQIENGTKGIIPCGTTGESPTLTFDEHEKVIELTVKHVAGRIPVIAGAGSNSTHEALRLARHAKDVGADAILVITPYYNKPTQKGLYQHYKTIADNVNIPIVIYNVPGRTGVNIEAETVAELSKIKNIIGIKEASGSLDKVTDILSRCDITVLSGEDALNYLILANGGKGAISVTANVVPEKCSKLCDAALEGDFETAKKLHYKLYSLNRAMFYETNPIPVKTALFMMGLITMEIRSPLCQMQDSNRQKLESVLKGYGLI